MKAKIKINKLGSAFFGFQTTIGKDNVWGRYIDNEKLTAEQQNNVIKSIFEVNPNAEFEIEYTQAEGKKGLTVSSIKEVKDGKVIEPTKEQTKTVKPEKKERVKELGTPGAVSAGKSKPVPDSVATSIERQVASKNASRMMTIFAGQLDPKKDVALSVDIYNKLFDAAITKISNK